MINQYKAFLTKIYLFQFFGNLMFIYPLYALMFADAGVSPFQISFLFAVWSLVCFLLEIPSWVLWDTYSRKKILIFSRLIKAIWFLVCVFWMSYRWFVVCLFLWWVSSAMHSWTLQAFVYDEMVAYWKEGDYTKVLWRMKTVMFSWFLIWWLWAMVKEYVSYETVLYMTVWSLVVSAISLLFIQWVKQVERMSQESYRKTLVSGISLSRNKKLLRNIILLLMFMGWITTLVDEYMSLYVEAFFSYPEWIYGFIYACFVLMWGIASYVAYYFKEKSMRRNILFIILMWSLLLYMWMKRNFLSLVALMIFEFFLIVVSVLMESNIQTMIKSSHRATITSVSWFWMQFISMIGYLLFWVFSLWWRYDLGYKRFWVWLIILGIWGLWSFRKIK